MTTPPAADHRIYAALALVSASALLLEVTLVRLLSVALWYPFAYVGLSTAMLGFGVAAVTVSLSARLRAVPAETLLGLAALGVCLSAAGGYPLWNALPVDPLSLGDDRAQLVWVPLLLVVITLPFAGAGLFISRTFAAWPALAPRLYAADLGGAAAGVLAYVLLLPALGGPGTLMVAAALAGAGALLVHRGGLGTRLALALLVASLLGSSAEVERLVPLRVTPNKLLGTDIARALPRGSLWTLSSAIDVIEPSKEAMPIIVVDGGTAMSWVPRHKRHAPIPAPQGLRGLAYALKPGGSTLVVGSGGGVEVYAALGAGSRRVVAVEIDGAVNALVRGRLDGILGGLFRRDEVELVTAEARAYLAAHDERFDVIAAFHTISNAASSTGAMSLAENYLLTREALALLFDRLTDDGVLVMSRPEQQLGRLCATLATAWPYPGDVHQHVAVFAEDETRPSFLTALVVSRRPLDAAAIAALRAMRPGRAVYLPDGNGAPADQAFLAAALAWGHPEAEARAAAAAARLPYRPAQLTPTTDDRPFFNLHRPWREIGAADLAAVLGAGRDARARLEDLPIGQVAILFLLLEVGLLALLFVIPPAAALRRAGLAAGQAARHGVYFAALGFGFITVEVVLIQSLVRIIGEPAWSMVTVLATLLAASGAGSFFLAGRAGWSPRRATLAAAGCAVAVGLAVPRLCDAGAGLPFAARIALAVLLVAPVGLVLGVPFSAGLGRLRREDLVAWAWALNGLLSVSGSILALVLGSSIGFCAAALLAAGAYLGAWATADR